MLAIAIHAIDKTSNACVAISLANAATALDKLDLLPDDSSWVFDYSVQPTHSTWPGSAVNANATTFPAAVGNGLTMAWLTLGPYAMLRPHYHSGRPITTWPSAARSTR